jgi:hypothetical protein
VIWDTCERDDESNLQRDNHGHVHAHVRVRVRVRGLRSGENGIEQPQAEGSVPTTQIVGFSFCPENISTEVK